MVNEKKIRRGTFRSLAKAAVLILAFASPAFAALERYDYDAIGRLIRVIDEKDRVTEYTYDAVGNILKVDTGGTGSALVPVISGISPSALRRGEAKTVVIAGQNLTIGDLTAADPQIQISAITRSTSELRFTATVGANAVLGPSKLSFASASGKAEVQLTINPLLPKVTVEPTPLAVPPDNVARPFTVKLSHADGIAHTLSLASSNANVATLGSASVSIPAGATVAHVTITGKAAGSAVIQITSPTLAPASVPVYVTGEFLGLSTSFARPLGVVLEAVPEPPSGTASSVQAKPLGVAVGAYLGRVSPDALIVGTESSVVITGGGIPADATVTVTPADGLTLGSPSVSADGKSLSLQVAVAPDAQPTQRRIAVTSNGQALPWASAQAGTLRVALPVPQLESIEPFFATAGQTVTLKIRGTNLHDASDVDFHPGTGILAEAPAVNANGTELSLRAQLLFEAVPGPRVVTVTTPGGVSSAAPVPGNTFSIVQEIGDVYTPITSRLLGVMVETEPQLPAESGGTLTSSLGVILGGAAKSVSPKVALIGETTNLTISGTGLQDVTEVRVNSANGVTAGTLSVASDGSSISVPITVALEAPQTMRTIELRVGTEVIAFVNPDQALFQVSAPAPVLESITPNVAKTGAETQLTVRGKDLHMVQGLRLEPAQGASFTAIQANAAGTQLTATMVLAADAAPGPRALIVTSSGGDSSATMTPENTITIAQELGPVVTPVTSPALGVILDFPQVDPPAVTSETLSAALGVVVQDDTPPPVIASSTIAPRLGVVVGSAVTALGPNGFARGTTGTLTIHGDGLADVSSVSIQPAGTGVTLGVHTASANQVSVPISIAADAVAGSYQLVVSDATGAIEFADPTTNQVHIGLGVVELESIAPILVQQGETAILTLRGENLSTATQVVAEPSDGIVFESGPPTWMYDALGEKLEITIHVPDDAALGPRVIRVISPGTISSAEPVPANILTVIAP